VLPRPTPSRSSIRGFPTPCVRSPAAAGSPSVKTSMRSARSGRSPRKGPCEVGAFTQRKSDLQDSIASLQKEIDELKALRKATKRHIPYKELPQDARFDRLSTQSKHFIDIIKMIAYRAKTAMAQILRHNMTRHDDARSLLRAIYSTEVDIVPDPQANTLTIRLHPLANTSSDLAVRHLCAELNTTETLFPGTELRLIYDLVSSKNL
jgi:hypothetical protein